MIAVRPAVKLALQDAPPWLSHIEITREDDHILIEVVKTNGLAYGNAQLSLEDFNNTADLLLTP